MSASALFYTPSQNTARPIARGATLHLPTARAGRELIAGFRETPVSRNRVITRRGVRAVTTRLSLPCLLSIVRTERHRAPDRHPANPQLLSACASWAAGRGRCPVALQEPSYRAWLAARRSSTTIVRRPRETTQRSTVSRLAPCCAALLSFARLPRTAAGPRAALAAIHGWLARAALRFQPPARPLNGSPVRVEARRY